MVIDIVSLSWNSNPSCQSRTKKKKKSMLVTSIQCCLSRVRRRCVKMCKKALCKNSDGSIVCHAFESSWAETQVYSMQNWGRQCLSDSWRNHSCWHHFLDYQQSQSARINWVLFQLAHLLRITSAHANVDKNRKTKGKRRDEKAFYWYLKWKKNPHIKFFLLRK